MASIRDAAALRAHLAELGAALPCDDVVETGARAPLAEPLDLGGVQVPNRFVIQPMEGWDATSDGRPSELTLRRWRRFGSSGAGWVWGGEAVAVMPGRSRQPQPARDRRDATTQGLAELRSRAPVSRSTSAATAPVTTSWWASSSPTPAASRRPEAGSPAPARCVPSPGLLDPSAWAVSERFAALLSGRGARRPWSRPLPQAAAGRAARRRLRVRGREALPRLPAPRAALGRGRAPGRYGGAGLEATHPADLRERRGCHSRDRRRSCASGRAAVDLRLRAAFRAGEDQRGEPERRSPGRGTATAFGRETAAGSESISSRAGPASHAIWPICASGSI